jgi:predicted secreted protein
MTTNAKIGFGTLFQMLDVDASPDSWVTVAEVVSITPPALARDTVEATHSESPEKWREFIPGLKDAGEMTVELNFIPGGDAMQRFLRSFNTDEPDQCRIVFPDGGVDESPPTATIWAFVAFLTGVEPEASMEDKMSVSATFKLTGKPDFVTVPAE